MSTRKAAWMRHEEMIEGWLYEKTCRNAASTIVDSVMAQARREGLNEDDVITVLHRIPDDECPVHTPNSPRKWTCYVRSFDSEEVSEDQTLNLLEDIRLQVWNHSLSALDASTQIKQSIHDITVAAGLAELPLVIISELDRRKYEGGCVEGFVVIGSFGIYFLRLVWNPDWVMAERRECIVIENRHERRNKNN